MILLVHLLFGAAIGSLLAKNIPLAIVLAFLSHYLLDLLPHIEYDVPYITKRQWGLAQKDFLKVALDFFSGIILIWILTGFSKPIVYVCTLFAILPDALFSINYVSKGKFWASHEIFHSKWVHFLQTKKISNFWRIATQVAVVIISIYLLRL